MTKSIWLNLPVKSAEKSKEFFTAIGFKLNLEYGSRPDSASFCIGESNFVMMLFEQPIFEGFVGTSISNTDNGSEVLLSIDAESKDAIDELLQKVEDAGGTIYAYPNDDGGFIYGFGFIDLDGHRWNAIYMDANKIALG
ncbi:putative lactoylglutathione lyase [Pedobacter sp. UYP30]|uniref:VOC family protein n=1 Tax=Pedobacter sp. UYP30 TaxID=1756400 RepID=UPI003391ACE0